MPCQSQGIFVIMQAMKGFRVIDHTADIGITAFGKDIKELFINAARGMFYIILDLKDRPEHIERRSVVTCAVDRDQLLVKWLQELLFLFDAKRLVSLDFDIKKITERTVSAEVTVTGSDRASFVQKHQIKAVTYHKTRVEDAGGYLSATVIFDI